MAEIPTTDPDVLLARKLYVLCEKYVNKDEGFISRKNLLEALQQLGMIIDEIELEAVISQTKIEEETPGGRVDLEEFLQRGLPLIRTAIESDVENKNGNNTHKTELGTDQLNSHSSSENPTLVSSEALSATSNKEELSPQQIHDIHQMFIDCDHDKDGKIYKNELNELMKTMGKELEDAQLDVLMHHLDKEGKGYIDFDGFLNGMLLFIAQSQSQAPPTTASVQNIANETNTAASNNNNAYNISAAQSAFAKIQLRKHLKDVFTHRTRSFSIDSSDKSQSAGDMQKTVYTSEDEMLTRASDPRPKRDRSDSELSERISPLEEVKDTDPLEVKVKKLLAQNEALSLKISTLQQQLNQSEQNQEKFLQKEKEYVQDIEKFKKQLKLTKELEVERNKLSEQLESLKGTANELTNQIKELKKRESALEAEKEQLKADVYMKSKELNDAQDELQKLKSKNTDTLVPSSLKAVEEKQLIIEQLKRENEKLQADVQRLSTQNQQLVLREEEQKRKQEVFEQQIHHLQEKLLNPPTEPSSGVILGTELKHEEERTKLLKEYTQLVQTLETFKLQYHTLEEQYQKLNEEYRVVQSSHRKLTEDNTQLAQQRAHDDDTIKNLLLQTQQQQDEIEKLRKELEQLSIEKENLQRERESVHKKLQNELLALVDEKQKVSAALQQQTEEFNTLKCQYEEQKQQFAALLQERTSLEAKLETLTERVASYDHEFALLKQSQQNELIERLHQQQPLEQENTTLKQQYHDALEEITRLKNEIASINDKLGVGQTEKEVLEANLKQYTAKINQLKTDMQQYQEQVDALRREREILSSEKETLAKELNESVASIAQWKSQSQLLSDRLQTANEQLSKALHDLEVTRTELATKEQLYTQLKSEMEKRIEELSTRYATLQTEHETLRKQYDNEVNNTSALKLQLETERQHFVSEREKLSASVRQIEDELNSLRSQCTQLRQQNELITKLTEERENLLNSIRDKEAQLTLLKEQLDQLTKNSEVQQQNSTEWQNAHALFENEKKSLLLQLQHHEQEIERLRKVNNEHERALNELRNAHRLTVAENDHLRAERETLFKERDSLQQQVQVAKNKLKTLQENHAEQQSQLEKLLGQYEEFDQEKNAAALKIEQLEKQIALMTQHAQQNAVIIDKLKEQTQLLANENSALTERLKLFDANNQTTEMTQNNLLEELKREKETREAEKTRLSERLKQTELELNILRQQREADNQLLLRTLEEKKALEQSNKELQSKLETLMMANTKSVSPMSGVGIEESEEVYEMHEKKSQLTNEIDKLRQQAIRHKQQLDLLQEELRMAKRDKASSKNEQPSTSMTRTPSRTRKLDHFDTLAARDEESTEYTPSEVKKPLIKPQNPPGCCANCSIM
jgi:chromosome segregation ATPase/Ca2+-binding EF-hand superfamily protein